MSKTITKRGHRSFSHIQKKVLINYLQKNPELANPRAAKFSYSFKDGRVKWQELGKILNRLPGSTKSWKRWRKTWHDLRHNTRSKFIQDSHFLANIDNEILKLCGDIPDSEKTCDSNIKEENDEYNEENADELMKIISKTISNPQAVHKESPNNSEENIVIEFLPDSSKYELRNSKETDESYQNIEDSKVTNGHKQEDQYFSEDTEQYEILDNFCNEPPQDTNSNQLSYYDKKLIILARIARAKERSADAKERIALALETISESQINVL